MIDVDDLIALVRNYNPKTDEALLRKAYAYGARAHEGQKRHSGEPYFSHPVAVAAILTEMHLDDATIVTALLHDTIEDTRSTYAEVQTKFGTEIAEGHVTKAILDEVDRRGEDEFGFKLPTPQPVHHEGSDDALLD